jgi:hypothetical protein
MEVLQRIKFLMEYDVMKTSSENILIEQDLGLKGKTIAPSAKPPQGFGKSVGGLSEKTLEDFTVEVREFMSRWETATVETIATMLGVGIPFVITANGFWLTLEVIQAVKGNPDYLSLVFALIATATAGSQSIVLKPLYSAAGKILKGSGKSVVNVFDAIYEAANKLGLWNKTKPILEGIKTVSKNIMEKVVSGLNWVSKNFKVTGITQIITQVKNFISGLLNTMDNWLANIGTKVGIKPQVAKHLGKATRYGSIPYAFDVGMKLSPKGETAPVLTSKQLDELPYDVSKWDFP